MTKGERTELLQLIRKRERVMVASARERAATMLADFEQQCASIYAFDDDEVWERATRDAEAAVAAAQEQVAARCQELGIPKEFAPGLQFAWYGRGQNAVAARRAELRRVAKKRIEAIEAEAVAKIERLSLAAQTDLLSRGLETDAARTFLQDLNTVEALMPAVSAVELKALVDARRSGAPA